MPSKMLKKWDSQIPLIFLIPALFSTSLCVCYNDMVDKGLSFPIEGL